MKKDTRKIITILVVFTLAIFVGYFIMHNDGNKDEITFENPHLPQTDVRITVEVEGEVKEPGEYSVLSGTSLHDVLHNAGGVTDEADLSGFDFDTAVFESCKIFVPKKPNQPETADEILKLPIDINKADAEEFAKLHGIGDKLASQIVNHRNLHGNFKDAEDLMNVKGIGKSKYEAIRDMITVGGN